MTLRLPEDLDRELDRLAAERHTSKSALSLEGVWQLVEKSRRRDDRVWLPVATLANDFVEFAPDGVPVTVYAGEGFKSERCGRWTKIG